MIFSKQCKRPPGWAELSSHTEVIGGMEAAKQANIQTRIFRTKSLPSMLERNAFELIRAYNHFCCTKSCHWVIANFDGLIENGGGSVLNRQCRLIVLQPIWFSAARLVGGLETLDWSRSRRMSRSLRWSRSMSRSWRWSRRMSRSWRWSRSRRMSRSWTTHTALVR